MSRANAKWLWAGVLLVSSLCTDILATGQQAVETSRPDGIVKFKTKVHVVLVPVLVLDREGHAVENLTQRDFRVFDRGKAQVISGFTVERRAAAYAETQSPSTAISSAIPGQAGLPNSTPRRFVAFLFDDVHLSSQELVHVRSAGTRMLSESLTSTDAAAVLSTSGRTNTGFTHDRARLQKAILSLRAAPVYVGSRVECPSIDHYEAFMIQNQHDPETLEAIADQGCSPDKKMDEGMARAAAAWEMAAGERATHISLDVIQQIARQMGALPGQRTLILISPGFIALTPEAMKDQAIVADTAAQANVTVSTLDARGLDPRTMPIEKAREATAEVNVRRDSSIAYGKVMSDLAASTGGTYIHDSNDLQGGLQRLAQPPECVYLLEFSPKNVKQDHTFHALRVKVDPKGLIIRARPGYFADSPGNDNQNAHPR